MEELLIKYVGLRQVDDPTFSLEFDVTRINIGETGYYVASILTVENGISMIETIICNDVPSPFSTPSDILALIKADFIHRVLTHDLCSSSHRHHITPTISEKSNPTNPIPTTPTEPSNINTDQSVVSDNPDVLKQITSLLDVLEKYSNRSAYFDQDDWLTVTGKSVRVVSALRELEMYVNMNKVTLPLLVNARKTVEMLTQRPLLSTSDKKVLREVLHAIQTKLNA